MSPLVAGQSKEGLKLILQTALLCEKGKGLRGNTRVISLLVILQPKVYLRFRT